MIMMAIGGDVSENYRRINYKTEFGSQLREKIEKNLEKFGQLFTTLLDFFGLFMRTMHFVLTWL